MGGAAATCAIGTTEDACVSARETFERCATAIDGFQGNQNYYVVVSWTRSNPQHQAGFLKRPEGENRRVVAQSRARCCLINVGDVACLEWDLSGLRAGAGGVTTPSGGVVQPTPSSVPMIAHLSTGPTGPTVHTLKAPAHPTVPTWVS